MKNAIVHILIILIFGYKLNSQSTTEIYTNGITLPNVASSSISNPSDGQLIYDTDVDAFRFYKDEVWKYLGINKTQEKVISSQTFTVEDDTDNYVRLVNYSYPRNGNSSIFIPVDIPLGSKLDSVSLLCLDSNTDYRINLRVYTENSDNSSTSTTTLSNGANYSEDGISEYQLVTNTFSDEIRTAGKGYFVRLTAASNSSSNPAVWPGSTLRFSKLIIHYELP